MTISGGFSENTGKCLEFFLQLHCLVGLSYITEKRDEGVGGGGLGGLGEGGGSILTPAEVTGFSCHFEMRFFATKSNVVW